MGMSGKSLLALSASAMPSSPGITMSVRRRSKRSPARRESAISPSGAAVTSCPPCDKARMTKALTAWSSSATRILAIAAPRSAAVADRHQDAGGGRIRLRNAGAKRDALAGQQALLGDAEAEALQFAAIAVAQHHLERRDVARGLRDIGDLALDDERAHAVLGSEGRHRLAQLETDPGWRHRQADHGVEPRRRRPQRHHVVAGGDRGDGAGQQDRHEQHPGGHAPDRTAPPRQGRQLRGGRGGADGGTDAWHHAGRRELDRRDVERAREILGRRLMPGLAAIGAAHRPPGIAERPRVNEISLGAGRTGQDHLRSIRGAAPYRTCPPIRQEYPQQGSVSSTAVVPALTLSSPMSSSPGLSRALAGTKFPLPPAVSTKPR